MADDPVEPLDGFESWRLRRIARAVEGGEVSADLVIELADRISKALGARKAATGCGNAD